MPRRKAFIDRARAQTFQLVQTADANAVNTHVFVPINSAAESNAVHPQLQGVHGTHVGSLTEGYDHSAWELGEFGFPEDGYDYSKHFKRIGGGGGVFLDVDGRERPENVVGSLASGREGGVRKGDVVVVKEDVVEGKNTGEGGGWKRKEDVDRERQVRDSIKRDRKWNKDLDHVFAALDSDGELESEAEGLEDADLVALDQEGDVFGEGGDAVDLLEDDFVAVADLWSEELAMGENALGEGVLEGVVQEYREPRVLDEQFEKFMRDQEIGGSDLEDGGEDAGCLPGGALEEVEELEEMRRLMTEGEVDALWDQGGGLLDDLASMQIGAEVDEGVANVGADGDDEEVRFVKDSANGDGSGLESIGQGGDERADEFERFTKAEFERGMSGLLDSYNRVPALEALGAFEGLDQALKAVARGEQEEIEKRDRRIELGLDEEGDGHDSELESHFDEMLMEKDDKWDCETIISTYSNLENHPSIIDAPPSMKRRSVKAEPIIRLDPRTQAPVDFMPNVEASASGAPAVDFGSRRRIVREVQARRRKETTEEKKMRKTAVKEAARERRALKSEMKKAFGSEHVRQSRHATALGTSKVAIQF